VCGGENMKARVLVSFFSSKARGTKDEVIDIKDQSLFDDLVNAGYVEAAEQTPTNERENISSDPAELKVKKARAQKVVESE
jgi:hypothetical protein